MTWIHAPEHPPGRPSLSLTPASRHGYHITPHEPVDGHPEELVGYEAERAQHQEPDEHLGGRDDVRALHDEEADTLVGGQHLRGHDAHEGKPQREPEPGEDVGPGRRQDDPQEDVALVRAQAEGGPDPDLGGGGDACRGVEQHRDPRSVGDDEVFSYLADAEDRDDQRNEGHRRDVPAELERRLDEVAGQSNRPGRHADHDPDDAAQGVAQDDAPQARSEVGEQFGVPDHLTEFPGHRDGRGNDRFLEEGPARRPPDPCEHQDRNRQPRQFARIHSFPSPVPYQSNAAVCSM